MLFLFGLLLEYQNEVLHNPMNSLEDIYEYAKTMILPPELRGESSHRGTSSAKLKTFSRNVPSSQSSVHDLKLLTVSTYHECGSICGESGSGPMDLGDTAIGSSYLAIARAFGLNIDESGAYWCNFGNAMVLKQDRFIIS